MMEDVSNTPSLIPFLSPVSVGSMFNHRGSTCTTKSWFICVQIPMLYPCSCCPLESLIDLIPSNLDEAQCTRLFFTILKAWIFHVGWERALDPLSIPFLLSVLKLLTRGIHFILGIWSSNNIRTGQKTTADLTVA